MARDNLKTYGEKLNAQELTEFLEYALQQNDKLAQKGKRGTPICVWGTHGIGKTESIIGYAKKHKYTTVYCAPAQFEEMGDLHGIPETSSNAMPKRFQYLQTLFSNFHKLPK